MQARGALRRLLRAAAAHDRAPSLKALLPLRVPGLEESLDSPSAVPLRTLVAHTARALPQAAASPADATGAMTLMLHVTALLELNLTRGRVYARKMREEEKRSLRAEPPSPSPKCVCVPRAASPAPAC